MTIINYNGQLEKHFTLPINSRGFTVGDSVWTMVKYALGNIFFWEDHYFRLMASMRIVRMQIPDTFTMEFLENQIRETLQANELSQQSALVRITITRDGQGTYYPKTNRVNYSIETYGCSSALYENRQIPYQVELYKDFHIQADLLSTIKTTNRIHAVMASIFAQENHYQNCILLNHNKNVVGTIDANLFLVQGHTIKTPDLSQGCINGITRKRIVEIIEKTPDLRIEQTSVSVFELQQSDELFITNTTLGIQSVSQYRKKTYQRTVAQSLLGKLNALARFNTLQ